MPAFPLETPRGLPGFAMPKRHAPTLLLRFPPVCPWFSPGEDRYSPGGNQGGIPGETQGKRLETDFLVAPGFPLGEIWKTPGGNQVNVNADFPPGEEQENWIPPGGRICCVSPAFALVIPSRLPLQ